MSDEKPPEKPTIELEKPPLWAQEMAKNVSSIKADVSVLRADVTSLGENYKDLSQRVTISERRHAEFEEWRTRSSERAKSEEQMRSKVDLEHSAQLVHLAEEMKKSFEEATKSQTATILAAAAKTPQGQKLINAIVTFVLIALTVAGGWLSMHGGAK